LFKRLRGDAEAFVEGVLLERRLKVIGWLEKSCVGGLFPIKNLQAEGASKRCRKRKILREMLGNIRALTKMCTEKIRGEIWDEGIRSPRGDILGEDFRRSSGKRFETREKAQLTSSGASKVAPREGESIG